MAYQIRISVLVVIVVLAWLALAQSVRSETLANRDLRHGQPHCVAVKPVKVIAWGYLLENGEIVSFDEARPQPGGTFLRCTGHRFLLPRKV